MRVKRTLQKVSAILVIILYCFGTAVSAQDLTSPHFIIRDPSIGTGGGYQSSASFNMYSAGNLNISGTAGASATFQGRAGFLQFPEAISGTLSAVVVGSAINLTWNATVVADGYTVSGYNIGIANVTGGPYTFTSVGNTLSYSYPSELPGNYFLVLQTLDAFGNVIATSNEATATVLQSLSFSISANTLSFGTISSSNPRYATASGGSNSLSVAHTISAASNAASGYTINYAGPTLTSGPNTISPATILGSNTGTIGTNQFALSVSQSGGATVSAPYDQISQNWNFIPNTPTIIAATSGPTSADTVSAYYIANADPLAAAGTYTTALTYEITANY